MPQLTAAERVADFLDRLAARRIPTLLVSGVALVSVGFGFALLLIPDTAWMVLEYGSAFALALPSGWGLALIVLGVALAVAYFADPPSARMPALLVTLLYAALSVNATLGASQGGRADVAILTAAVSWMSALAVVTAGGGRG